MEEKDEEESSLHMSIEMETDEEEAADGMTGIQPATDTSVDPHTMLDCYPYTFTPLLLFAESKYFDKGHSNYNSVASFFESCISTNMLENVVTERKNMLYEELYEHCCRHETLVTCCIDSHFTALQVVSKNKNTSCGLYYDPCQHNIKLVTGDNFRTLLLFLLLKCNYADSNHIQENKDHYMSVTSGTLLRRAIYQLWRRINTIDGVGHLPGCKLAPTPLKLKEYLLVNSSGDSRQMSTQQTSNTCYFQVFLYAVLCKVGILSLNNDGRSIDVARPEELRETTIGMSQFLLEFFVSQAQDKEGHGILLRPLTNSNFVLDFYRYQNAPYYETISHYLRQQGQQVPNYELQYIQVLDYLRRTKCLHLYEKFTLDGAMSSSPNTKSLVMVCGTNDAAAKLGRSGYYKYRPANLMFGFNAGIVADLTCFCEFNALRKNQLLRFYESTSALIGCAQAMAKAKLDHKYRDYYFMPQYEVGQQELIDVHHYTYLVDHYAMKDIDPALVARIRAINDMLVEHIFFSTQKTANYEKFLSTEAFRKSKKPFKFFLNTFMSLDFLTEFVGLGFADINPKEKEINSLSQTVFYSNDLMKVQAHRQSYEFEKECINQMAKSNLRRYARRFEGGQDADQTYRVNLKIGYGYTYSKYNTLLHFLNVAQEYWNNPDLSNIQVIGKDIRGLLAISCQKIFFEEDHCGYYHYGPFQCSNGMHRSELDLAVATSLKHIIPGVSQKKRGGVNDLIITERVFEFNYLKGILVRLFDSAQGIRFKSDNEVLNLILLSLMLDFGLYKKYATLLNLPFLQSHLQHQTDTKELQVEMANLIYEFDRKNTTDPVTRSHVEELLFECSYKFLVNKDFPVQSDQFKLIRMLNGDPDYQSYVLLVKIYMSLCQINKSVEVDYYKVHCDSEFRIIIPDNYSKTTSDYLEEVTRRYTFSEREGIMLYDDLPVFDLRPQQPEINLHRIRLDSATEVQSMVKYVEISNAFHLSGKEQYLVFVADNVLLIAISDEGKMSISINKIGVEMATIFFNEAISFVPCFKYAESDDVVLFTSKNVNYMVDKGGQFCTDYYGMKHELIECINSDEVFVDLNDEHVFKNFKLSELLTESKTVVYFPDYLLQVTTRQQLINLLDYAIHIRNVSFFILVLFYLRRSSVLLQYTAREDDTIKITGPWREAIIYVLGKAANPHYDDIFERQFFDLNQHKHMPLVDFIETLCGNFTKYQRFIDGDYQIIPTQKQKAFLKRIICSEECMHFSEVGSGKTKVILPALCQIFLSNNLEAHKHLARGGKQKDVLVVLVPEHLVSDASAQVHRYCLNLNFREEYRVYSDIFALLHANVKLDRGMKQIFVCSFNQFKKSLTYDSICAKMYPHREQVLVVSDEVDDFLDRNKLVFNICSNKNNSFDKPTLDRFFGVCSAAYSRKSHLPLDFDSSSNPEYWDLLFKKCLAIQTEIQDASRSINKSFGIFNEHTLRHCSTNIVHDIEGYKSLIARPYESVNRAMPGSYYSDVERTIYLTYVVLMEDIAKYDELFQAERKFISFEYWNTHFVHQLDFDDLVYGHEKLSEIVHKFPETTKGLTRYLYEIILRRMEIRNKSRSVNSIDVIFNFDCIGFTGTPFLDNYPSAAYIREERKDEIPNLIDRSFYGYTSEGLSESEFEQRFMKFQGQNKNVMVEYVRSDFIRENTSDEMATLEAIFDREKQAQGMKDTDRHVHFNAIVDLCGIFKQSTVHDVCDLILKHYGPDVFHYLYHIDSTDNSDRVLCIKSGNDVQYDEEFYKLLCNTYDADLRDRIFFFIDNRNVIGKDVPFQLIYQRHFGQPLFSKSVVLAHDVDDFSSIWQAMGRSRTMNETQFTIYKSGIPDGFVEEGLGPQDFKKQKLTRHLYIHNCDCKMAGNISSIHLTLVALYNLSQKSFYYCDEIVNTFLEKMENTIMKKVVALEDELVRNVLGNPVPARMLFHILRDKFRRSSSDRVAGENLTLPTVEILLRNIVRQKFEQRKPSGDVYDDLVLFLSGEQQSLMEISYTKQQQKQKQKQQNKNQDSDAMGIFDKKNQLNLSIKTKNYFKYTLNAHSDVPKICLNLPVSVPILTVAYSTPERTRQTINVYPTLQFLYSHHIFGAYMEKEVQDTFTSFKGDTKDFYSRFLERTAQIRSKSMGDTTALAGGGLASGGADQCNINVLVNFIRQHPQYTIAGIEKGIYIIGMKDQFNIHDLRGHPIQKNIQYVADEMGFILTDRTAARNVDSFGPYFIEQYILMEVLSKQEVAQNVMEYYCNQKATLQRGLDSYGETQGKGFVCWRFLMNETVKAAAMKVNTRKTVAPADKDLIMDDA